MKGAHLEVTERSPVLPTELKKQNESTKLGAKGAGNVAVKKGRKVEDSPPLSMVV